MYVKYELFCRKNYRALAEVRCRFILSNFSENISYMIHHVRSFSQSHESQCTDSKHNTRSMRDSKISIIQILNYLQSVN